MQQVFVIVIEERHSDVEVEVWLNLDAAIVRAREVAEENARGGEIDADSPGYGLAPDWRGSGGWMYWLGWGEEGDSVRVQAVTVQGES